MSYKVTRANEAVRYEAPAHFDYFSGRLQSPDDVDGKMTLAISHFLPGGGSEMGSAPVELVYYVVEGEMTFYTDDGKSYRLLPGDSLHTSPKQGRYCRNTGSSCAKLLVVNCK